MLQLILTVGLPASGKTTWAKEQLKKYPNRHKRINRDDLRMLLDNERFNVKREKFITKIQKEMILSALDSGHHVIVDDTNLNPKTVKSLTTLVKGKAEIVIKNFTDVTVDECIKRDLKRPNSVGEKVIRKFHEKYFPKEKPKQYNHDPKLQNCIICDLDGTLSKMVTRGPFDFLKCDEDVVNEPISDILKQFKQSTKIILLSGRDGIAKDKTLKWLEDNNIPFDELHMRKEGDFRKDCIIKKELFDNHIKDIYNVSFVLDDRDQVVELWRSMGLTCLQVDEGSF